MARFTTHPEKIKAEALRAYHSVLATSLSPTTIQRMNSFSRLWLESNTVMSSQLRLSYVRVCSRGLNSTSMENSAAGHQGSFPVASGAGKPPPELLSFASLHYFHLNSCIIFTLHLCVLKIFCCPGSKDNLDIKT